MSQKDALFSCTVLPTYMMRVEGAVNTISLNYQM